MTITKVIRECNSRPWSGIAISLMVAMALCTAHLSAQTDSWVGGSGQWSVAANWSLNQVPSASNDCSIPAGASPTVDLGGTCQNLTVGVGSTINMNPGYLDVYGTSLSNSGTISIAGTPLNIGGNNANTVTLSGGGTIAMNATNSGIEGFPGVGGTLVNVDNTVQGQGDLGLGVISITNQATISASGGTLSVQPNGTGLTNTGTMQSMSGATLSLQAGFSTITFTNTGGTISALSGGTVFLGGGTFIGGTLTTAGSGIFTTGAGGGNPILDALSNDGTFIIPQGAAVILEGSDTNTGSFQLQGATLYVDGAVTLQGKGKVTMTDSPLNVVGGYNGAGTLTLVQSLSGAGTVGNSALSLVNQSTIKATGKNNHLIIAATSTTNPKTLEASSAATLELRTPITNTGGKIEALSGGTVLLNGATITGGTLTTAGTGTFQVSTGTLDGTTSVLTNSGTFVVADRNFLNLQGTINNTGVISLDATGGCLSLNAPTTLEGSGILTMSSINCILASATTDTLTNKSTIEGGGTIGGSAAMGITNTGTMIANQSSPLNISPDSVLGFYNTGTLTVNSGSTMNITSLFKNINNGSFSAGTYSLGGTLSFPNAAIKTNSTNLTLTGPGAQILDYISGNIALKTLATNNATGVLSLQSGAIVTTTTKLINKGKLTVGSGSSLSVTSYTQSASTTTVDGKLTAASGLTVQGGSLIGKGTLVAQVTSNGSITTGDSTTNPGVLTVSGAFTQSSTGVLNTPIGGTSPGTFGQLAVANGVSLNGTLNLSLANGFVPTIGSTFSLITGSSVSGQFATVNGTSINSGEHFEVTYSGTAVTATVVSGA